MVCYVPVVCCSLFVGVQGLLIVAGCSLFVLRCLLAVVRCCCLLFSVRSSLRVGCCVLFVADCV